LAWDALADTAPERNPFMRFAYLSAMFQSGSATPETGWSPLAITLWNSEHEAESDTAESTLQAACIVWVKTHSYGEYVFDWAWANAYQEHGLRYYPKATVAVPFTPVPGPRLLARDTAARQALVQALVGWCAQHKLSSLHLLFTDPADTAACENAQLMLRHTVQFHWTNHRVAHVAQDGARPYADFDDFLASLNQDKRKKIRQERRKVQEAGVSFTATQGREITPEQWDFFYRCYERTYLEHGNAPYLTRDFFVRMATDMPENWLLFTATRDGQAIATSLIAINDTVIADSANSVDEKNANPVNRSPRTSRVAYGRYWGALERVDCLHFEACYYQPLDWCIRHGFDRFEGGAQGEHKMARALLPVKTHSAHWLAHPSFANAVQRFLEREGAGIEGYMANLEGRSPLKG
jgi:predicted N-acyltransferase